MESLVIFALLVSVAVPPAALECVEGNCNNTEFTFPSLRFFIPSLFSAEDSSAESDILPATLGEQDTKSSELDSPSRFMSIIKFTFMRREPEDELKVDPVMPDSIVKDLIPENSENAPFPGMFGLHIRTFIFKSDDDQAGVLDLSGRSLTGNELYKELRARRDSGEPVTKLVLSNCRIDSQDAGTYAPAESTIQELQMDNCSVNFDALRGLTNLKTLNLSNNGLTTFPWYANLMDSLEVLDLSHNKYEEVRPELSNLKKLRELNLSYNRISSVEKNPLEKLPNLEVLLLSMNTLENATVSGLQNLKKLDVSWNYLRRNGYELQLPDQRLQLKLASNPWRCDCGILDARDNNDVLDIDQLQCANEATFSGCEGCYRYFLPLVGQPVANMTVKSIQGLGCNPFVEQYYKAYNKWSRMMDDEPEEMWNLVMLSLACLILFTVSIIILKQLFCYKKVNQLNQQSWLKSQQIPFLNFNNSAKTQDVPYVKMDEPNIKTIA